MPAEQALPEQALAEQVRGILKIASGLGDTVQELATHDNLWHAGMNSLASVRVLVALEETFAVEFPDGKLTMEVFASIDSLTRTVLDLQRESGEVL